jgi:hypothetical protein
MNLEPEVLASAEIDSCWREWPWRKTYRVWEANYKVLLNPENWYWPELRDDKTPFFKQLEGELLQDEVTQETIERALHHYLEKLDEVARLEIVGMYHQQEKDSAGNLLIDRLHVFGRTAGEMPKLYYRTREEGKFWTAWEEVGLSVDGQHLVPVVWNGR